MSAEGLPKDTRDELGTGIGVKVEDDEASKGRLPSALSMSSKIGSSLSNGSTEAPT